MKTFGEVRHPKYSVQYDDEKPVMQLEIIWTGWNRGKLISDPECIIFEDVEGIVHVVKKSLFFAQV